LRRWKGNGNGRSKQKKQGALQDGGWDYSRGGEGRSERAEGGDRKILCIYLRRHRCGAADGDGGSLSKAIFNIMDDNDLYRRNAVF